MLLKKSILLLNMQKFPVKQGKYLDGPQGGSHILHQAIVSSG